MHKLKLILLTSTLFGLFACSNTQKTQIKTGYLKDNISQEELSNPTQYKRYYYSCQNFETGTESYLSTYFPLSRESRMKDNFGIYFQLDNDKVQPFDHIANKPLNVQGSRFEVIYRSYHPIQGAYIDLIASESSSVYYKDYRGMRSPWLDCKEG
ncbi:hypothetical protein [Basfia succiniciproducens]|uniref:Lipoprotein n=1 Tax=Basfia succiniciproducens TaxID=653940 RepID=A0A1G5BL56_9PAST|nr:hypothetical protein [Basfia succiniciproducens]QIM68390.1 hypothetical protein A4G13_02780 [Basfia succiniciproducens]SCX90922.1 hypothetical protein SAMN02910354_00784 [Basfia succiniciproducens]